MPVFDDVRIRAIEMVANLNAMGEREAARLVGENFLAELALPDEALLYRLGYDSSAFQPSDPDSLVTACYLCALCKEVMRQLRVVTGGNSAKTWFRTQEQTKDKKIKALFEFLARKPKSANPNSDAIVLADALKALRGEVVYYIPASYGALKLEAFLQGVANGTVRV